MLGTTAVEQTFEKHYEELWKTLDDPRTLVFLDTSVLGHFYELFRSARAELLDWCKGLASDGRLRVPGWAASEYFGRVSRDRLNEYSPDFNEMGRIPGLLTRQLQLARLAIDDSWLKSSTSAKTREEFLAGLSATIEELGSYLGVLKKQDSAPREIHREIVSALADAVLKTDVGSLCSRASKLGQHRYQHRLPPGYLDADKDENPYGDLCLWVELLEYAPTQKANFDCFVLLTNDVSKDWCYAPPLRRSTVSKNGFEKNDKPKIRLTDPRLVQEFDSRVCPKRPFCVASVEDVVRAASTGASGKFRHLSAALQLRGEADAAQQSAAAQELSEVLAAPADVGSTAQLPEAGLPLPQTDALPPPTVPNVVPHPAINPALVEEEALVFGRRALRDSEYDTTGSAVLIDKIINRLRSHNWYTQNPAINEIDSLGASQASPEAWFVLGRNIYQAACGNAFDAMEYLQRLSSRLSKFDSRVASQLLAGMLYEVYFDAQGDFRTRFKVPFLAELLSVLEDPRYSLANAFIRGALEPRRNCLLLVPGEPVSEFDVKVQVEEPCDEPGVIYEITQVFVADRPALADVLDDSARDETLREDEILQLLCTLYALPESKVRIRYEPEPAAKRSLYRSGKKTFKTACELMGIEKSEG